MTNCSLAYSPDAHDALPLFRRNHFKVIVGGAVGKSGERSQAADTVDIVRGVEHVSSEPPVSTRKLRTPGLSPGAIQLSDDFDDPLPDEFWLGIE